MNNNVLNQSWFAKYKPQTFEELIFESDEHKQRVANWIQNGRPDGNILFYGPPGLGKTATTELLIKSIIKAPQDLLVAKDRSIKEIKENFKPFLNKSTIRSNVKIIYIEEIDKMHPDALNELKVGLMEKYIATCIFICCTNYIQRLSSKDSAILGRFTYKIPFEGKNIEGLIQRLVTILQTENAQFNIDDLRRFIESQYQIDIRDIINQLQNAYISNNGVIDFSHLYNQTNIESQISNLFGEMINIMCSSVTSIRDKKLCYENPTSSPIAEKYSTFVALVHNNYNINYDIVFDKIYEKLTYIPAKLILAKYEDNNSFKKHPQLNIIGCFYEVMKCISEMTIS